MIRFLALTAILLTVIFGLFHMRTHVRGYFYSTVKFTIATKTHDDSAFVMVSFLSFISEGLYTVAPGGSVSVNKNILPSFPTTTQGWRYWTSIPKSALYKLEYSLGAGYPVVVHEVSAREFSAVMPSAI